MGAGLGFTDAFHPGAPSTLADEPDVSVKIHNNRQKDTLEKEDTG
jgi:hypothetical protein